MSDRVAPGASGKPPDAYRDRGSSEEHIQTNMLFAIAHQLGRIADNMEADDE